MKLVKLLEKDGKKYFIAGLEKAVKSAKEKKIEKVMKEFAEGKLKSSSGDVVTDKKQAIAIAYSEAENMQKASKPTKYYKRVPKATGKGYNYYYTKAEYDKSKKEKPEKEEKKGVSFVTGIMKFFGLKTHDDLKSKIDSVYGENKEKLKGVGRETFVDYLNEYLSNKDKWDKKLAKKETISVDKKKGTIEKKKKGDKRQVMTEKGKKWNMSLMRTIQGIVGGAEKPSEETTKYGNAKGSAIDVGKMTETEAIKNGIDRLYDDLKTRKVSGSPGMKAGTRSSISVDTMTRGKVNNSEIAVVKWGKGGNVKFQLEKNGEPISEVMSAQKENSYKKIHDLILSEVKDNFDESIAESEKKLEEFIKKTPDLKQLEKQINKEIKRAEKQKEELAKEGIGTNRYKNITESLAEMNSVKDALDKRLKGEKESKDNFETMPEGYNETAWNHFIKEAKRDKEWAEKTNKDENWKKGASKVSLDMLKERLKKPIGVLAKESYDYTKMRSELKTESGRPIDESAKILWEEISKQNKMKENIESPKKEKKSITDEKEEQALESVNSPAKLKKRIGETLSVMKKEAKAEFSKKNIDFENKRMISDDGTKALQWKTRENPKSGESYKNQQTTKGIVKEMSLVNAVFSQKSEEFKGKYDSDGWKDVKDWKKEAERLEKKDFDTSKIDMSDTSASNVVRLKAINNALDAGIKVDDKFLALTPLQMKMKIKEDGEKKQSKKEEKPKKESKESKAQKEYDKAKKEVEKLGAYKKGYWDFEGMTIGENGEIIDTIEDFSWKDPDAFMREELTSDKSKWDDDDKDAFKALKDAVKAHKKMKQLERSDELLGPKMFKAKINDLEETLIKAKKAEIGEVRTGKDGKKRKKIAPGKWVEVTDKKSDKTQDKKSDKKSDKKQTKPDASEQKETMVNTIKTTLKKMANILADALSGKDVVQPTGGAIEETGTRVQQRSEQRAKSEKIRKEQKKQQKKENK